MTARRKPQPVYPDELRAQIAQEHRDGLSFLALSVRHRISESTIQRWCTAQQPPPQTNFSHPPETVAAVRADYADGLTLAEIAATHKVTTTTVNRWCNPTKQPRPGQRLLTVAPLLRFLADRQLTPSMVDTQHGINLQRCVRDGGISWVVADRVAGALGCHAFQIWTDEWWQAALGDQWDATNEYEETA